MERDASGNGKSPKEKISALLAHKPSGPDFTQSTIGYGNESIGACLDRLKQVVCAQYPNIQEAFEQACNKIASRPPYLAKSDFVLEDGKIKLVTPRDKRLAANSTLRSVYSANPNLGRYEYAFPLYLPKDKSSFASTYPWMNSRLKKIAEIGNLSLENPIIQIIAVGYITQMAKIRAVTSSRKLLKKLSMFAGINSPQNIIAYLKTVEDTINEIRRHQGFVNEGLKTISQLGPQNNLDGEHIQLILDLAFIRNRAFEKPEEFRKVLQPLCELVASQDWQEAFLHRDFLLKFFGGSFPEWRKHSFQESAQKSFDSMRDFIRAINKGDLVIEPQDIPERYRDYFEKLIPRKLEKARKIEDQEIRQASIRLSMEIVRNLDQETRALLFMEDISTKFGRYAEKVLSLFSAKDQLKSIEEFAKLVNYTNQTNSSHRTIATTYVALRQQFQNKLHPKSGPPYEVRTPQPATVMNLKYLQDNQTYTSDVSQNRRDFGALLYRVIKAALNPLPGRPALDEDTLIRIFTQAWSKESQSDKKLSDFTLEKYLMAICREHFTNEDDPVAKFISSFKTYDFEHLTDLSATQ